MNSDTIINIDDNELNESLNPTEKKNDSSASGASQPSVQVTPGPMKVAFSALFTSFVALFFSLLSLFSSRVASIKENKIHVDNKKLIDDTKSMLASQKSFIMREKQGIYNIEERIKAIADQIRQCKNDQTRVKNLREEAYTYIRRKKLRQSTLKNTENHVHALEETMSQVEQFSMSMEAQNQMKPLIKNLSQLIPSKNTIQKIKNQRMQLIESTRKLNIEMNELNQNIIQSGEEYQIEQEDDQFQLNTSIDNELDKYIESLDVNEADDILIGLPDAPKSSITHQHPSHQSKSGQKSHHEHHAEQESKPLISEFESMG